MRRFRRVWIRWRRGSGRIGWLLCLVYYERVFAWLGLVWREDVISGERDKNAREKVVLLQYV